MSGVSTVIAAARAQIGKPYVYGEDGPSTFDCSGLITYVFAMIGVTLPHNAAQQQRSPQVVKVTNPAPGDLVFYGNPAHHVALYIGGGQQIAAPHSGANVKIQGVSSGATYGRVKALGSPTLNSLNTALDKGSGSIVDASFDIDGFFDNVQGVSINLAAGALGLVIVGAGVFLLVTKQGKKILNSVT